MHKRIRLFYLLSIIPILICSCEKQVPDDDICDFIIDSSFKAFCYNKYDSNQDGKVSSEEASWVDTMNCSDIGIESLDGIEYFRELTTLLCRNNRLIVLDLSKNVKLTRLECEGNQLQALNLSKNTEMSVLNCSNNNLKSLDVSFNIRLRALECSHNYLSSLDVSQNTGLEGLWCSYNYLTWLDVTNCPKLSKIYFSYNPQRQGTINPIGKPKQ